MPDVWWTVGLPALLISGYMVLTALLCLILAFSNERSALERALLLLGVLYFMPGVLVYMMVTKPRDVPQDAPSQEAPEARAKRRGYFRALPLREKMFRTAAIGIACLLILAALSIACFAGYQVKTQWHSGGW